MFSRVLKKAYQSAGIELIDYEGFLNLNGKISADFGTIFKEPGYLKAVGKG